MNTIFVWLNEEFEWVQTDYVERTVEEILARRAGNCAEQAKVVEKYLTHIGIETRWILEINSHSENMERQNFSLNLIENMGISIRYLVGIITIIGGSSTTTIISNNGFLLIQHLEC